MISKYFKPFYRLLLLTLVAFFFSVSGNYAYSSGMDSPKKLSTQPLFDSKTEFVEEEWVYDTTVSNIQFYHKVVLCGQKNAVFLRFVNLNKQHVNISWMEAFVTSQVPQETDGFFGEKQLLLKPGETQQTDCFNTSNPECLISFHHVNPTYLADILKFKFKDIKVSAV